MQKVKEKEDSKCIYQNELDKARFQHNITYRYFKCLPRRTTSDKVLSDEAFNISKTPNYDG